MLKEYKRIQLIDAEILELQSQIGALKSERGILIRKTNFEDVTFLNQLPARARNALVKLYIDSDLKLRYYLEGCYTFANNFPRFYEKFYKSANTFVERLMLVPNIGEGTATEVVNFLQEHDFFKVEPED